MQRCEKNEATLGYKMPKMHQAPVAVPCAMRIAENEAARGKPLKLCTLPSLPKQSPASCYLKSWISEDCSTKNPKIQKSIFSNRIFGFRSKRWIFGFPKVFFDFFGFFERVFGFLGFQVKNPKKFKEKDGIFKKSKKPKEKDGFLQKSKKT